MGGLRPVCSHDNWDTDVRRLSKAIVGCEILSALVWCDGSTNRSEFCQRRRLFELDQTNLI